jgi:hypothetical protein
MSSTCRIAKWALQPTAWSIFENVGLVVPIHGCFAILEHFFVLLFFGFAMPGRFVTDQQYMRLRQEFEERLAHAPLFRPFPLAFGSESNTAAYSGLRVF